ncbi:MAG: hypothetical protein KIG50_03230 [Lachnospiraceae bacterium]|nr:hypothetical protein [Lachnospiraceae bacterium]
MIGWLAVSLAGHDKKKIYIIIEETVDAVLLADGECRPLSKPKRKKKKHIQVIKKIMDEKLAANLREGNPCRDEEIKRAVKIYKQSLNERNQG